jgi:glutathione gamma-glutamylcysteinyltransferase
MASIQSGGHSQPQFYQRPLPSLCIPFDSSDGQQIFAEALSEGGLRRFFGLVSQFRTQDEPAYCGLGTLTMALNTLQIDPGRVWKGVWRWYDESLLDCCKELDLVKTEGITLDEFVCLSRCNGCNATMVRADDQTSVDAFRRTVAETCGGTDSVLACSYSRRTLGQTGDGHFSPIGGYHKERDLVLLLDVARFKYPPHWVPLSVCYDAMRTVDKATGQARGWVVLSVKDKTGQSHICNCCSADKKRGEAVMKRLTAGLAPVESNSTNERPAKDSGLDGWMTATTAAAAAALLCAGLVLVSRSR